MKDGWHKICGRDVFVEDGFIRRAMKCKGTLPAHVYRYSTKHRCWINEGKITPAAFAAGVRRGTIDLF